MGPYLASARARLWATDDLDSLASLCRSEHLLGVVYMGVGQAKGSIKVDEGM